MTAGIQHHGDVVWPPGFQELRMLVTVAMREVEHLVADACDAPVRRHITQAHRQLRDGRVAATESLSLGAPSTGISCSSTGVSNTSAPPSSSR